MLQEILRVHGALELADPNIMQPLSILPDNYQDIISNAGGLRPILEQSGKFLFDGNRVMIPEDKDFEDLVQTLKPKPSNNPFLERTMMNGSKNNDANCQNGTRESKSMCGDDSVVAEILENGASGDFFFPSSVSPPLNPDANEFLPSSQTDSLTFSSSKTSLASADSTLKDVELVDDQIEDEKNPIINQEMEQTSNGSTTEENVLESEHINETTKTTIESQQDYFADSSSGTVTLAVEPSSISGKNFEDSSCDLSQAVLAVETVEKQTVVPTAGEDTASVQTSNHKPDGNSSSSVETLITSKTKAVQTQPNVKSKGVGTDPIPEPFKAEYHRAVAEKDALQARLQESTERHNALITKNNSECDKVKKKLADALQEKEVNILDNARVLIELVRGACENLVWIIGHFQITLASFSKRVLVTIFSLENKISYMHIQIQLAFI